jgi:sortase A
VGRSSADIARTILGGVFELAMTVGAVILLFVVYEVWVTDIRSDHAQKEVAEDVRDAWATNPPPHQPEFGDGFAFLHVPRFGDSYSRAVVEGTEPEELEAAPGHYVNSAMPGQPGNFALAGHRVGLGSPFEDLDKLQRRDAIVVETADSWHVYRVTTTVIVPPTDNSVVAPTPGGPLDGEPTGSFITLTTCHPKFSARERLVVHGELETTVSKMAAPEGPPALGEVG